MEPAKILLCTSTGCTNPRADQNPEATNRHCGSHRAETFRKGNATRLEQQRGKEYMRGSEDMRHVLAVEFDKLGAGMMSCSEVAWYIRQAVGPLAKEATEKKLEVAK
jgi:hypothetical protein